ncbi:XRE family transcriptional regulator [Streptomyces sp. NPDC050535]|uniref:XRE family transcriptional regulator n=1 Tax=Streptomyces sp. NPDC050535 TaxID=3365626 RepID=UPI0037B5D0D4
MTLTSGERVRAALGASTRITGDSQARLATAPGVRRTRIGPGPSGTATWSHDDRAALATHHGTEVPDLPADPTRACEAVSAGRRRPARTTSGPAVVVPAGVEGASR